MALDDFFKRQREEQDRKREAERLQIEKRQKEIQAKEEFEKKLPDFFKNVVDPAIQMVTKRFEEEKLLGIYAFTGRRFRAARPSQRIDRDFYVQFHNNPVQFHIFPRIENFDIVVEVSTEPKIPEHKNVDTNMYYDMDEFNENDLLSIVGTTLETIEGQVKKEIPLIQM